MKIKRNDVWERKFWRDLRRIHKSRCKDYANCDHGTAIEDMTGARKRGLSPLEAAKELA